MSRLSARQEECLEVIIDHLKREGRYPTYAEIAQIMQVHPSTAQTCLNALDDKGYVRLPFANNQRLKLLRDIDGRPVEVKITVTIQRAGL